MLRSTAYVQLTLTKKMMNKEALVWAYNRLKAVHPTRWREDAEALLAFVLDKETSYLFAHGEDPLSFLAYWRYRRYVSRRLRQEPIQYITGHAHFYGHEFLVERGSVLIPRPETELLVERAIELSREQDYYVVDVGTGSGCIAISIACTCPSVQITAIDYSCDALDVAMKNAKRHGVAKRITFVEDNLLTAAQEYLPKDDTPLLFVMNLPYLSIPQMQTLPDEVREHEPHIALVAGEDGLDSYRGALTQVGAYCSAHQREAKILLEIDPGQSASITQLVADTIGTTAEFTITNDYTGRERMVEVKCI